MTLILLFSWTPVMTANEHIFQNEHFYNPQTLSSNSVLFYTIIYFYVLVIFLMFLFRSVCNELINLTLLSFDIKRWKWFPIITYHIALLNIHLAESKLLHKVFTWRLNKDSKELHHAACHCKCKHYGDLVEMHFYKFHFGHLTIVCVWNWSYRFGSLNSNNQNMCSISYVQHCVWIKSVRVEIVEHLQNDLH